MSSSATQKASIQEGTLTLWCYTLHLSVLGQAAHALLLGLWVAQCLLQSTLLPATGPTTEVLFSPLYIAELFAAEGDSIEVTSSGSPTL